jgi:uncharacterized protein YjbI with pentapeptide repeats
MGEAQAYNTDQLNRLKSGVPNWNEWIFQNNSDIDLSYADLQGMDLTDAFLRFADLHGANLEGANLHDADLIRTNLREANLKNADLTDTSLADTTFRGADLRNANLSGYHYVSDMVDFQKSNLIGANLDSYSFDPDFLERYSGSSSYGRPTGLNFYGATYDNTTQTHYSMDLNELVSQNQNPDYEDFESYWDWSPN